MRILIVKTSSLGDILQAFPCVNYIKSLYPNAKIDWVVEKRCAELVQSNPYIERTLCIDTKTWKKALFSKRTRQEFKQFKQELQRFDYQVVFDLQGNSKSALVTYLAKSFTKVGFGAKTVPEKPNLLVTHLKYDPPLGRSIRQDYLYLVESYFKLPRVPKERVILNLTAEEEQLFAQNYLPSERLKVMVCPGSAWENKQLSQPMLKKFIRRIEQEYTCDFYLLSGNDKELKIANELAAEVNHAFVIHKLPLPSLQRLMTKMTAVIAVDSLPLHLAISCQTPTFGIFGPSSATKYASLSTVHKIVQGGCPYGKQFEKRCTILRSCKDAPCMKQLTDETLWQQFQPWFDQLNKN